MKNKRNTFLFFVLFLAFTPKAMAQITVSCSFHQLCNVARELYIQFSDSFNEELHFDYLVREDIDPHDYAPAAAEVKKLLDAKILLLPRFELQPWAQKIKSQRDQDKTKKTFLVPLDKEVEKKFNNNTAALAHFWLYPELLCQAKKDMAKFFNESISMKEVQINCATGTEKISELKIKKSLGEKSILILTHDALLPYFEQMGVRTYALKGSHHHDEISPRIIKEISGLINQSDKDGLQIIWLYEEEIPVPSQIKKLAKKNHKTLMIKLNGKKDESPDQVTKNLGRLIYTVNH